MSNNDPSDDINQKLPFSNNTTTLKKEGWNVKEAVLVPDTTPPKQRVDLNPVAFQTLIEQKGLVCCVYRTMYCPNVKSADGAEHQVDCPLCNGSGYIDFDPIDTKVLIQNQDLKKAMTEGGDFDGNTVLMSFPTGVEMQYFAKIVVKDFTDLYYQRVYRNPASMTDNLKFRACRVNGLIDQNGVKYFQQQDFDLDQNGNIKWGRGRTPANGLVYSLHFETHVQYRTTKAMHVSRFTQFKVGGNIEYVKMPEQWLGTKEFMLRRRDINTNQDIKEGPFEAHTDTTGNND